MAMNRTDLGDSIEKALTDHKDRLKQYSQNGNLTESNIDSSTEKLADAIAKAVIDQVDNEAYIEGGIVVRDSNGNQIGTTDPSGTGKIT